MIRSRRVVLLAFALAGAWAMVYLDLAPGDLMPSDRGWAVVKRFLAAAVSPALVDQSGLGVALVPRALGAAWTTIVFAATAMSLALIVGFFFGLFASATFWRVDGGRRVGPGRRARQILGPILYTVARTFIALMRSVHELLWATLFLAAFGLHDATAVIAIAIPFGGTLAKVFSEMIDEAPRAAADALGAAGATTTQSFFIGLLPHALPDMAAYAFYRFECAVRSAAILGFFGIQTLGSFIQQSFEMDHFREVWTYLYTLFLVVALLDWWSGSLRRRLVAA